MAAPPYTANLIVADVLRNAPPEIAGVFLERKTACVGCYLARFCTLEDVANTYDIPRGGLLGDLERAAHAYSLSTGGQDA